jgi:hypothetical protein
MFLMWGWNHMHNKAAIHKDEWEDFFQHCDTLRTNKFWTTTQPLTGRSSSAQWYILSCTSMHKKLHISKHILTPPFHVAGGSEAQQGRTEETTRKSAQLHRHCEEVPQC